ncbi:MAG: membrane protein insertase YidC [Rhodocyclaceae bacterium]|nr:membrane protein insertase YidC [Rhodocyclaceae bacterium]
MDNRRLIVTLIFCFSLIMLWEAWQKQSRPLVPTSVASSSSSPVGAVGSVPAQPIVSGGASALVAPLPEKDVIGVADTTVVRTDLYVAKISAQGGDLVELELIKHPDSVDPTKSVVLFDAGRAHVYLGQSGALGEGLPNHRSNWKLPAKELTLREGEGEITATLEAISDQGNRISKTYTFKRGSYLIEIAHSGLVGGTHVYHQITRDGKPAEGNTNSMMMGVTTFTGPAVFTNAAKFQKVAFSDIADGSAKYATKSSDGWLGMVQHYFVSAWILSGDGEREFYMRKVGDNVFSSGVISPVAADGSHVISLYAGPQEQDKLAKIAPGLELVVDYGWLTVIAAPLFWVLQFLHDLSGNWGWAIIGLTILLKLAFFPLSAASYKSMAKMRVMTPKLMKLKETYGDDKARLNQEMMELYKREKVNPLGGCLPVLVQIPVFIALYWVLLGAVEMRNAPWLGWIADLSVKDPYFILPIIMGVTMVVQTKLNPAPPDPIQAKVMAIMPIIFTGMFLFFPAGLVLYWTVNNLLSIAQQWQINRMIDSGASA